MRIEAKTNDHIYLSEIARNQNIIICDCRGDEDQGYTYLCEFPDHDLLLWIDQEMIDL